MPATCEDPSGEAGEDPARERKGLALASAVKADRDAKAAAVIA
jgi:hypothetical protein